MRTGDVYSVRFDESVLGDGGGIVGSGTGFGSVQVFFDSTNSAPNSTAVIEIFEDRIDDPALPSVTSRIDTPHTSVFATSVGHAWQDLQGATRITVLSGPIVVDHVHITAGKLISSTPTHPYRRAYVATFILNEATSPHLACTFTNSFGIKLAKLSWPTNATAFLLESLELAPGLNWKAVTNTPAIAGPNQVVTLEANTQTMFFRLRKP